ncbi:MAG: hypothetical protein MZV63_67695 [Marinilabiliales bacterium]|nr:hypothetical protein [Marinilabiliales bacterium]
MSTLLVPLLCACNRGSENTPQTEHLYRGLEFDMPVVQEPVFPDNSVSITDFGAVGDGRHLNTAAFADAIGAVAEKGGGTVIIPPGLWLTGPVILKSNIRIHAEDGAMSDIQS